MFSNIKFYEIRLDLALFLFLGRFYGQFYFPVQQQRY